MVTSKSTNKSFKHARKYLMRPQHYFIEKQVPEMFEKYSNSKGRFFLNEGDPSRTQNKPKTPWTN